MPHCAHISCIFLPSQKGLTGAEKYKISTPRIIFKKKFFLSCLFDGLFLGERAMLRHLPYVLPVLVQGEAHHIEDPATQGQVANWGKEVSEPEQGMPHEVNFLYLTVF